jgi:hypothetical protein
MAPERFYLPCRPSLYYTYIKKKKTQFSIFLQNIDKGVKDILVDMKYIKMLTKQERRKLVEGIVNLEKFLSVLLNRVHVFLTMFHVIICGKPLMKKTRWKSTLR